MTTIDDCFLCHAIVADAGDIPWHDTPIMESEYGIALAGIGALSIGYVLVSPKMHVRSTTLLAPGLTQPFAEFFETVLKSVESRFTTCTIFEHGGSSEARTPTSACIDHAHLHIMPGHFKYPSATLTEIAQYNSILAFLDGTNGRSRPYLLYKEPGERYILSEDTGEPQFFRRHVARELLRGDEWDYAAAPNFGAVWQTIETMNGNNE